MPLQNSLPADRWTSSCSGLCRRQVQGETRKQRRLRQPTRRYIEQNTQYVFPKEGSRSPPKQVYDFGVSHHWALEWCGPAVGAPVRGENDDPSQSSQLVEAIRRAQLDAVAREGQSPFRRDLLQAYQGRCAITGWEVGAALEAAHIVPYLGPTSNQIRNGLLLRADLHTLFDRALIQIDPDTQKVIVHESLLQSEYGEYHGTVLRSPTHPGDRPSSELLSRRRTLLAEAGLPVVVGWVAVPECTHEGTVDE